MDRTVKLKLNLSDECKETLRQTMILGNRIFNEIARYGFENHTCSKVSVHHATYYCIREKHPELPCSILQGIRDVACEALKGLELKKLPVSKPSLLFDITNVCIESIFLNRTSVFLRLKGE